jgi:hypothetical protein
VGLATAGGLAEIAAGVLGTVATWDASTGSSAAGREAQTPRLVGACERQARWFFVLLKKTSSIFLVAKSDRLL